MENKFAIDIKSLKIIIKLIKSNYLNYTYPKEIIIK